MLTDLKPAIRQLAKSPGFTGAAVLVLALGIGANTALFSVVNAALLRPLPFPQPDRLVRLYEAYDEPDSRANTLNLSELTLRQWREQGREVFVDITAATGAAVTFGARGEPARTFNAARVSANFFPTLGLPPALGRSFTAEEDQPGGPHVAVIGWDFWQRELAGRPDVLGQTVPLDGMPFTIVGVMPAHFRHPYRAEIWLPLQASFDPAAPRGHYLYAAARLRPGVSYAGAEKAVRQICRAINAATPDSQNPHRAYLRPLREGFVADLRPKLLVIAAAALCALLVAAANFAGLLLTRAVTRESEYAIRAALGASPMRLVRETLAQAMLLAAAGTAAGLLLAAWLSPLLVFLSPEGSDATGSAMREFDYGVRLDWTVFGFAAVLLLLVGLGFGLLPARQAARVDLRTAINRSGRSATLAGGARRLLGLLVVAEIAATAVLLIGSGMLAQYFRQLVNQPWGFALEHRLSFNTMLSERLFPDATTRLTMIDRSLRELRALPGVRSVTVTLPHPGQAARQLIGITADGVPVPEPRGFELAYFRASVPGYFATVGQVLLRGRDFTDTDRADTAPVCIIDQTLARRWWPGQDPIGKRIKLGRLDGPRPWVTVVGLAADTKIIADPNDGFVAGSICLPLPLVLGLSNAFNEMTFVIETDPAVVATSIEHEVRTALARADSRVAVYELASFTQLAVESRTTERFALILVSGFGMLGLVLSSIGLYGVLALQVARRRRELAIRSALGATARELIALVVTQGGRLLVLGLMVGGAAAAAAWRLVHREWPDMPALGVLPLCAAVLLLTVAVALACWLPARRAARINPIEALRAE